MYWALTIWQALLMLSVNTGIACIDHIQHRQEDMKRPLAWKERITRHKGGSHLQRTWLCTSNPLWTGWTWVGEWMLTSERLLFWLAQKGPECPGSRPWTPTQFEAECQADMHVSQIPTTGISLHISLLLIANFYHGPDSPKTFVGLCL